MRIDRRGDTLVEVLLATVILSLVMAGAFTISNRATQIGQNSLERSQVSNYLQEQVEIVRSLRDGGYDSWDAITERALSGSADYSSCEPTSFRAFYINYDASDYTDGVLNLRDRTAIADFDQSARDGNDLVEDSNLDFFDIWMEVYRNGNYIELHARACWDQLGGEVQGEANAVYGLQDFGR